MGRPRKPTPWEIAKPLLEKDYLDGTITDDMRRGAVHKMRKEYEAVSINNFGNNFLKMKRDIKAFKDKAEEDALALQNDRMFYPKTLGRWDGSDAQRLLKQDVDEGLHNDMNPVELWLERDEYQQFGYSIFYKHIQQEKRSRIESNYWLNKRAKKARKKALAASAETDNLEFFVDDNDYF